MHRMPQVQFVGAYLDPTAGLLRNLVGANAGAELVAPEGSLVFTGSFSCSTVHPGPQVIWPSSRRSFAISSRIASIGRAWSEPSTWREVEHESLGRIDRSQVSVAATVRAQKGFKSPSRTQRVVALT
jgi:hypothetical protein